MGKKLTIPNLAKLGDEKALAIAVYGESVASYRYTVLAEKARTRMLRDAFEAFAAEEREHRDRLQGILQKLSSAGGFLLSNEDKSVVCVGPRLVDARDEVHFDEAMRLVISSEKRTASFYRKYAEVAVNGEVKALFGELAAEGIEHVHRLRELFREAGKQIAEPCPVSQMRMPD